MIASRAAGRGARWLKDGIGGVLYMPCVLLNGKPVCRAQAYVCVCDRSQHHTGDSQHTRVTPLS